MDVRDPGTGVAKLIGGTGVKTLVSQSLVKSAFTDGGGTSGFIDFTTGSLPAGAIVLGWDVNTTAAFSGDTSAAVTVGTSGATSRFSAETNGSAFTVKREGSASVVATSYCDADVLPRVTVTSTADFTNVAAGGTMVVTLYYIDTVSQ
jgi:hypothetical protein